MHVFKLVPGLLIVPLTAVFLVACGDASQQDVGATDASVADTGAVVDAAADTTNVEDSAVEDAVAPSPDGGKPPNDGGGFPGDGGKPNKDGGGFPGDGGGLLDGGPKPPLPDSGP